MRFFYLFKTALLLSFFLFSCGNETETGRKPRTKSLPEVFTPESPDGDPFLYTEKLTPADGFDFPVGKPDARGYYDAQPFMKNTHLGEDWNGTGGGNSDLGDPVYALADGIVFQAGYYNSGWGNVIRMVHKTKKGQFVESFYGHVDTFFVKVGDPVKRGQHIANIGNADGAYWAHLHLEMRWKLGMETGGGYSRDTSGFLEPKKFIRANRPGK